MSGLPEGGPDFPDRSTVVYRRRLSAPAERAWRAISSASELAQWFMETELELRPGGRFSFHGGWDGTIGALEPGRLIRFDSSDESFTRFALEPDGAATRFVLTDRLRPDALCPADVPSGPGVADEIDRHQPGGPGTHWTGVLAGWHCFADALVAHLGGRPFAVDFPELCLRYDAYLTQRWADGCVDPP